MTPGAVSVAERHIGVLASAGSAAVTNEQEMLQRNRHGGYGTYSYPTQLPERLEGPLVWTGEEMQGDKSHVYVLTRSDKEEVTRALGYFKSLGLDGNHANQTTFPLPKLGVQIRRLNHDLFNGRGFFSLRGLEPTQFNPEDNIVVFLGISSYVAEQRGVQDDSGNMLTHIREAKHMSESQGSRPLRDSNTASAFHTDTFCDVLAMQTRSLAATGGNHLVVSASTVYNELAATRKDVIQLLASPIWGFDNRGRLEQLEQRSLLYYHNDRIILNFVREALVTLPDVERTAGIPKLSEAQLCALRVVEGVARKHRFSLELSPGDLTFVNNFALLHSREAFTDDKDNTRYVVRMWLKNKELAWSLPPKLAEGNSKIFDHGDIVERWNIRPKVRLTFNIRERLTP